MEPIITLTSTTAPAVRDPSHPPTVPSRNMGLIVAQETAARMGCVTGKGFASLIRERFGVPAFIQNDANACAVAEWKYGAGRGCEKIFQFRNGLR